MLCLHLVETSVLRTCKSSCDFLLHRNVVLRGVNIHHIIEHSCLETPGLSSRWRRDSDSQNTRE